MKPLSWENTAVSQLWPSDLLDRMKDRASRVILRTECRLNSQASVIRLIRSWRGQQQSLEPSWVLLNLGPLRQGFGQMAILLRPRHQGPHALFSPGGSGPEFRHFPWLTLWDLCDDHVMWKVEKGQVCSMYFEYRSKCSSLLPLCDLGWFPRRLRVCSQHSCSCGV